MKLACAVTPQGCLTPQGCWLAWRLAGVAVQVAGVLAACGQRPATDPPPSPPPPRAISDAPALAAIASPIPLTAKHLVVGVVADWTATTVELRHFERAGTAWRALHTWAGVVGRTGVAWGAGLHGVGAPSGRDGPIKREGDGKSPAGVFAITGSFGYAAHPPAGATLGYTAVDDHWQCVDDPGSASYARVLDRRTIAKPDWSSHEQMRRPDELYRWVIDLAHNPARTAGTGSCIFFHIWAGPGSTTVGCTAMPEAELATLITTLDPGAAFVLLPRTEYDALAASWQLPP